MTSVSAELGNHPCLHGNSKAMATVAAILDGTASIGRKLILFWSLAPSLSQVIRVDVSFHICAKMVANGSDAWGSTEQLHANARWNPHAQESEIGLSYSHFNGHYTTSTSLMLYIIGNCKTNSITWHENPGLTSNRFHFLAYLQIRVISQCKVKVISEWKKIFEQISIAFKISFSVRKLFLFWNFRK
jgi:hypothetical protein